METVPTDFWGGLLVTLVISSSGIAAAFPLGILLALGRRSPMPIVRWLSIGFIEFVRGVPLITVLIMANTMLPLFLPAEITVDRLARPLVGVALFASAYMAEVVRGGLQAMPKGQYEGAMSLGLNYFQMMVFIILPQALRIVIPGIVNTFIGLFKDTSLVAIVGPLLVAAAALAGLGWRGLFLALGVTTFAVVAGLRAVPGRGSEAEPLRVRDALRAITPVV